MSDGGKQLKMMIRAKYPASLVPEASAWVIEYK